MKTFFAQLSLMTLIMIISLTVAFGQTKAANAVSAEQTAEYKRQLVYLLRASSSDYYPGMLFDKVVTFNLSQPCWEKTLKDGSRGRHTLSFVSRSLVEYLKKHNEVDLERLQNDGVSRKENLPRIEKAINQIKDKLSITVNAENISCNQFSENLLYGYLLAIADDVMEKSDWVPKEGTAHITLTLSPTAKDISVEASADGKQITVVGPSAVEPSDWTTKIRKGFELLN